jgi:hypothetical protein
MKTARILEESPGSFGLEYDTNVGRKNTMRLDAITYEQAIREAKSFLGINAEDVDAEGASWNVE